MAEERLDGGNIGGAVRLGDTVRRAAGPWTPAVHMLLTHLAARRFTAAPRPLGFDEQGREVLTFLEGRTVGSSKPWPRWVHADEVLDQVARWVRGFTDFAARPDRLHRFLDTYGWPGNTADFIAVVRERVKAHADGIRERAAAGDAVFTRLLDQGVCDDLDRALSELATFTG